MKMMSAAPLAAPVAPATAIPTLAYFKAGASFTPSPTLAKRCLFDAVKVRRKNCRQEQTAGTHSAHEQLAKEPHISKLKINITTADEPSLCA